MQRATEGSGGKKAAEVTYRCCCPMACRSCNETDHVRQSAGIDGCGNASWTERGSRAMWEKRATEQAKGRKVEGRRGGQRCRERERRLGSVHNEEEKRDGGGDPEGSGVDGFAPVDADPEQLAVPHDLVPVQVVVDHLDPLHELPPLLPPAAAHAA
eukprot:933267-Rhodomonas_salina.6